MGEAKRRRLAGKMPYQGNRMHIPDDIKADIARAVRNTEIVRSANVFGGGECFVRNAVGMALLRVLGIETKMAIGGMVYRTGPDEDWDVVAFCGQRNLGTKTPMGMLAHYFLLGYGDIIDFSVGDWSKQVAEIFLDGNPVRERPAVWTVPCPEFHWAPRENFKSIPGKMTPDIGEGWYTRYVGPKPPWNIMFDDVQPLIEMVMPGICKRLHDIRPNISQELKQLCNAREQSSIQNEKGDSNVY